MKNAKLSDLSDQSSSFSAWKTSSSDISAISLEKQREPMQPVHTPMLTQQLKGMNSEHYAINKAFITDASLLNEDPFALYSLTFREHLSPARLN